MKYAFDRQDGQSSVMQESFFTGTVNRHDAVGSTGDKRSFQRGGRENWGGEEQGG